MNESERENQDKPTIEEILHGKDVSVGKELVELLQAEGIGTPVYYQDYKNKKIQFLVDREIGEEDFTVRQKEEKNLDLLGIVLPTGRKEREYVFLGIRESGIVFNVGTHMDKYNPEVNQSVTFAWTRFGDYLANMETEIAFQDDPKYNTKVVFREHERPDEYMQIVVKAVENQRNRQAKIKEIRSEIRRNLFDRLFKKK